MGEGYGVPFVHREQLLVDIYGGSMRARHELAVEAFAKHLGKAVEFEEVKLHNVDKQDPKAETFRYEKKHEGERIPKEPV